MGWPQFNDRKKVGGRKTEDEEYEEPNSLHKKVRRSHEHFLPNRWKVAGRKTEDEEYEEPNPLPRKVRRSHEHFLPGIGCRSDGPRRSDMPPMPSETRLGPEQQLSPPPPARHSSPAWEEERPLPPHRESSSRWQEEKLVTGLGTLPFRSQPYQPAQREAVDANQGQRHGAKVGLQTPFSRRQWTPEEDDEDGLKSSRSNSLGESGVKAESKGHDRSFQTSDRFEVIEHDVYESTSGSADEDGYVHVPGGDCRPHGRSFPSAPK